MGQARNAYRNLAINPEGIKPFGAPRHRQYFNIKIYRSMVWTCGLGGPLAVYTEHDNENLGSINDV
jgi:hypothetical protein